MTGRNVPWDTGETPFGSVTYVGLVEEGEQQARTWHRTVAVLTEDAPDVGSGGRGEPVSASARVMAEWRLPNGATRTGGVPADDGSRAGAKVAVWLDIGWLVASGCRRRQRVDARVGRPGFDLAGSSPQIARAEETASMGWRNAERRDGSRVPQWAWVAARTGTGGPTRHGSLSSLESVTQSS